MDSSVAEIGNGDVATVMLAVGDALADALVRPGRVVVHLVFSQDGAQVRLAEDQHAVEEFSAQGGGARWTSAALALKPPAHEVASVLESSHPAGASPLGLLCQQALTRS